MIFRHFSQILVWKCSNRQVWGLRVPPKPGANASQHFSEGQGSYAVPNKMEINYQICYWKHIIETWWNMMKLVFQDECAQLTWKEPTVRCLSVVIPEVFVYFGDTKLSMTKTLKEQGLQSLGWRAGNSPETLPQRWFRQRQFSSLCYVYLRRNASQPWRSI